MKPASIYIYREVINHVEGYVREHIHTNGIENFWSLLNRGLGGTYISVEPFHLRDRFALVVNQVGGKRLTYAELTGKTGQLPQQARTGAG